MYILQAAIKPSTHLKFFPRTVWTNCLRESLITFINLIVNLGAPQPIFSGTVIAAALYAKGENPFDLFFVFV